MYPENGGERVSGLPLNKYKALKSCVCCEYLQYTKVYTFRKFYPKQVNNGQRIYKLDKINRRKLHLWFNALINLPWNYLPIRTYFLHLGQETEIN